MYMCEHVHTVGTSDALCKLWCRKTTKGILCTKCLKVDCWLSRIAMQCISSLHVPSIWAIPAEWHNPLDLLVSLLPACTGDCRHHLLYPQVMWVTECACYESRTFHIVLFICGFSSFILRTGRWQWGYFRPADTGKFPEIFSPNAKEPANWHPW